jgi:hypothetical protein
MREFPASHGKKEELEFFSVLTYSSRNKAQIIARHEAAIEPWQRNEVSSSASHEECHSNTYSPPHLTLKKGACCIICRCAQLHQAEELILEALWSRIGA